MYDSTSAPLWGKPRKHHQGSVLMVDHAIIQIWFKCAPPQPPQAFENKKVGTQCDYIEIDGIFVSFLSVFK